MIDTRGKISEKGQISLKIAKMDAKQQKKLRIYTGMTDITLKFDTNAEKNEWLQAINECQDNLRIFSKNKMMLPEIMKMSFQS